MTMPNPNVPNFTAVYDDTSWESTAKRDKYFLLIYGADEDTMSLLDYLFKPISTGNIKLAHSYEAEAFDDPILLPAAYRTAIDRNKKGIYVYDLDQEKTVDFLPLPSTREEIRVWVEKFIDKVRKRNYIPIVIGIGALLYFATQKKA